MVLLICLIELSTLVYVNIDHFSDLNFFMYTGYNPKALKENCSHQCGNITVPFPFGLEEGCSARRLFQLDCSDPAHSVLQYNVLLRVTYIDVSEGLISIKFNSSFEEMEFNTLLSAMMSPNEPDLFVDPLESASVQWAVANLTCHMAEQNSSGYACVSNHSTCINVISTSEGYVGYRCKCSPGFEGNPYVQDGCSGTLPLSLPIAMIMTRNKNIALSVIYLHD